MSFHCARIKLVATVASIAVVLGTSSSLSLAQMNGMGMMEMEKKGAIGGKMPADDERPEASTAGSMQNPVATPAVSDMMGRRRGSMQGKRGTDNMARIADFPGFPGASHLYHVGATGFFLDHPENITLSTEQQTALTQIQQKTLLDRSNSDRRIEVGEQELWTLTAADAPVAVEIDAKVRAIERLRGDQRLAFIRAVGEAGKVLTVDQRAALLGTKPPAGSRLPATTKPAPAPSASPMPRM